MARRLIEVFGSFPTSNWGESFASDLVDAQHLRIASGFTNLRGARGLVEELNADTRVDFLLGLPGCEGPDVVRELRKHPVIDVRGSLVVDFHWKVVSIVSSSGRVLYLGSANLTSKGMSGSGEIMLRLTGSVLEGPLWDTIQADFDAYFAHGTTLSGDELLRTLELVERAGDSARGAQADLETAIEEVVNESKARAALDPRRAWFILWDDTFTPAEQRTISRTMGDLPSEAWTRGEVQELYADRIKVGDVVLGYSRDDTEFILGVVGRLDLVWLTRNRSVWIADLQRLAPPIDGQEHPEEYAAIRKAMSGSLTRDGVIAADMYTSVIHILRKSGLFMTRTQ